MLMYIVVLVMMSTFSVFVSAHYRGISLMCHVAKLHESVLEARLRSANEDKLGPWQHGFRK